MVGGNPESAAALDTGRLRELLMEGAGLWRQIDVVTETGSTNADLAERARTGRAGHGTALLTGYQSAGRGRLDRSWSAPPQTSLALSMLVLPRSGAGEVPAQRWTWLP